MTASDLKVKIIFPNIRRKMSVQLSFDIISGVNLKYRETQRIGAASKFVPILSR